MPAHHSIQQDERASNDISLAVLPCDIGGVPGLLSDISSLGAKEDFLFDRNARLELVEKARSLVRALETPRETMMKHVGAQVLYITAFQYLSRLHFTRAHRNENRAASRLYLHSSGH